jgi:hypothetical protein
MLHSLTAPLINQKNRQTANSRNVVYTKYSLSQTMINIQHNIVINIMN